MNSLSVLFLILITSCISNAQSVNFNWAKKMGGQEGDYGSSIAVDNHGNVYTLGSFQFTADFDPGAGSYSITSAGSYDIFISKLDASGNFVWAKTLGSTYNDQGYSIAVDSKGSIYVNGTFGGTVDFDPGLATFNLTASGLQDVFILKLDSAGNFKWVAHQENSNLNNGKSLVLDSFGNIYSSGVFQGNADFDPGLGVTTLTTTGAVNVYITKLDTAGNFKWANQFRGNYSTTYDVFCDKSGNVYTSGSFRDTTDFDPGMPVYNLVSNGFTDNFISKLDSAGNFVWAKTFGNYDYDYGMRGSVDFYGNVYMTGGFKDTIDFDPGSGVFNLISFGGLDLFVSKLDINGNFVWAKKIGEISDDYGNAIHTDSLGNNYIVGCFFNTLDFNPNAGVYNLNTSGVLDIFILKLDANGNFVWANSIGGMNQDMGFAITVDKLNNVYTTGYFQSTADFDPGSGIYSMTCADSYGDVFIHKIGQLQVGIKEPDQTPNINVFPNPTKGILNITETHLTHKTTIEIYNSLGTLVFKKKVEDIRMIDISALANGMYLIKIIGNDEVLKIQKIIKQ